MSREEAKHFLESRAEGVVHMSDWIEISQERIDRFGRATDDHQWIHMDVERAAAESPYDGTIAHGYLVLSMLTALRGFTDADNLSIPGIKSLINYGCNKVRFTNAVPAGARVRGRFELRGLRELRGDGLLVTEGCTIELEGAKRAACVLEFMYIAYF